MNALLTLDAVDGSLALIKALAEPAKHATILEEFRRYALEARECMDEARAAQTAADEAKAAIIAERALLEQERHEHEAALIGVHSARRELESHKAAMADQVAALKAQEEALAEEKRQVAAESLELGLRKEGLRALLGEK